MKRLATPSSRSGAAAPLLLALSAAALVPLGDARGQSREWVDVSLGGTAASNPFLLPGDDNESAAATLTVDPSLFTENEVSTFTLQGQLRLQQYTSRYGTDASGRLNARGTTQLSERTSLSSSVGVRSSRSAAQYALLSEGGNPLDLPDDAFPEEPIPDFTTAGRRARSNAISASTSISHVISPADQVEFGLNVGLADTDEGGDHRTAGLHAAYRKQVSVATSASATVNFGHVDYLDRTGGDARYVTPMVGVAHRLSQNTSLSAQVGATFTSIETGLGDRENDIGLAASLDLCNRTLRQTVCASASRQARPTTFGGVSTVTSLGLSYGVEVGENGRVALAGRYGRSKSLVNNAFIQDRDTEIFSLSSRYSHRLNDRLSAFVAPSYTRVDSGGTIGSRSSYRGEVGIRLRIGAIR